MYLSFEAQARVRTSIFKWCEKIGLWAETKNNYYIERNKIASTATAGGRTVAAASTTAANVVAVCAVQSIQWQSDLLLSRCVSVYFNMLPFSSTSNALNEVEKLLFAACYMFIVRNDCALVADIALYTRTPWIYGRAHAAAARSLNNNSKKNLILHLTKAYCEKNHLNERGRKQFGNVHKLALSIFEAKKKHISSIRSYWFLTNQHRRSTFSHAQILYLLNNTFVYYSEKFGAYRSYSCLLFVFLLVFISLFLFIGPHSTTQPKNVCADKLRADFLVCQFCCEY